jgi:two-component system, OmpR family, KDP operon response regulator KdpE
MSEHEHERDPEARIIYVLCIVLAVPFVVAAFVRGQDIGAGTTMCMLIAALGVVGLVVDWRKRTRLPRARVVRASRERSAVAVAEAPIALDTILVVEDEPAIRQFLRTTFAAQGLHMIEATTLAEGQRALDAARPAVVLLDLGLPDGDGLHLLRNLRASSKTPVIVLSARDRELDKITALDAGADDYLMKPFDTGDLVARVQMALRRVRAPHPTTEALFVAGPFEIDQQRGTVTVEGRSVVLTRAELRLLVALARQPGKLVTYRQLIEEVWGSGTVHGAPELRVHVAALRRKIEKEPARPRWLVAEAGVGYRLLIDQSDDGAASRSL